MGAAFPPGPVVVTVEATVDAEHDTEFNTWYDNDHMPRSMACPGFIAGARYKSCDDKPRKYLSTYLIDSETAMDSPELAAIRGFAHLGPFVRYERRIYRLVPGLVVKDLGAQADWPPRPAIGVVRASIDAAHDLEFNEWYANKHMPQAVGCPGFRAGARYGSSDRLPKTYLALYVIDGKEAFETPELAAIRGFEHLTPYVSYERRIYAPLISFKRVADKVIRNDELTNVHSTQN